MKFINLNQDNLSQLLKVERKFKDIWEKQKRIWRHMPLLFTWSSWSWKDTVLEAVSQILDEKFWVSMRQTKSRYLTREMRQWEEKSPLNFISREEFETREFSYSYEYGENLYGLDINALNHELQENNVSLVNGSPASLQWLFDTLFSQVINWSIPPLIFFISIALEDNYRLLEKRGWDKKDIRKRQNTMWNSREYMMRLRTSPRYKKYFRELSRSPSLDPEENQYWFNEDVIRCVSMTLGHLDKYLEMSPQEISNKRTQTWVEHIQNRP